MIGTRKQMLVVVEKLPNSKYKCLCDCGNERIVKIGHFNAGTAKSCGCHWKTGLSRSREMMCYQNMMARCHNPKNKRYKDYGAMGIEVCKEWRDDIRVFYKDMGPCPDGYQIDRIDNTKGYSKENCRWVSAKENMANRSVSRKWFVNGQEFVSAMQAAKKMNVSSATIIAWCKGRLSNGKYYPPKVGCHVEYVYPKNGVQHG